MRNFTIIREADKEHSFYHNNVRVYYVGTCPETGISFYCALHSNNYGLRVKLGVGAVPVNATTTPKSASLGAPARMSGLCNRLTRISHPGQVCSAHLTTFEPESASSLRASRSADVAVLAAVGAGRDAALADERPREMALVVEAAGGGDVRDEQV